MLYGRWWSVGTQNDKLYIFGKFLLGNKNLVDLKILHTQKLGMAWKSLLKENISSIFFWALKSSDIDLNDVGKILETI